MEKRDEREKPGEKVTEFRVQEDQDEGRGRQGLGNGDLQVRASGMRKTHVETNASFQRQMDLLAY
jgi:hypothetical protein